MCMSDTKVQRKPLVAPDMKRAVDQTWSLCNAFRANYMQEKIEDLKYSRLTMSFVNMLSFWSQPFLFRFVGISSINTKLERGIESVLQDISYQLRV
jgi:hypothetical protein